jgi:hypothetical protein
MIERHQNHATPLLAAVLLCFVCIVGCKPPAAGPAPERPSVGVAKPVVREIVDWDEYTGRLAAVDISMRFSSVTGRLLKKVMFCLSSIPGRSKPFWRPPRAMRRRCRAVWRWREMILSEPRS